MFCKQCGEEKIKEVGFGVRCWNKKNNNTNINQIN